MESKIFTTLSSSDVHLSPHRSWWGFWFDWKPVRRSSYSSVATIIPTICTTLPSNSIYGYVKLSTSSYHPGACFICHQIFIACTYWNPRSAGNTNPKSTFTRRISSTLGKQKWQAATWQSLLDIVLFYFIHGKVWARRQTRTTEYHNFKLVVVSFSPAQKVSLNCNQASLLIIVVKFSTSHKKEKIQRKCVYSTYASSVNCRKKEWNNNLYVGGSLCTRIRFTNSVVIMQSIYFRQIKLFSGI